MKNKILQNNVAAGEVSFNVIPLVDCIFLMIIFFILTSQMADPNVSGMVFLSPIENSMGKPVLQETMKNRLIVNVISDEPVNKATGLPVTDPNKSGQAQTFAIGTAKFGLQDIDALTRVFRDKRAEIVKTLKPGEEFFLVIRCDWRVRYDDVRPLFEAAANAGIAKMNISAENIVKANKAEGS